MTPLIIAHDAKSKRNAEAALALYDEMINKKAAVSATARFMTPGYIQHNPLIPTSAKALGEFFTQMANAHPKIRVVIYRVIASGDWVWAHVNFINIFNDADDDRGIAGVDIYRFDDDGKMVEHWDALQEVPDPTKAANTNGMF
jgi:predicted SnoaL-like aldol condensation-catalyzing enzyme